MVRAYCVYARRRANRGLDADHQVVAVTALFYYHELQPIGASGDFAAPPVFKPIYSWPESAAVNGRP